MSAEAPPALGRWEATAMASRITIQARAGAGTTLDRAAATALGVFRDVDTECSRFRPASPLSMANASPGRWHRAPALLLSALSEAHSAYALTDGVFDPRIHDALVALGYDRSFTLGPNPEAKCDATPPRSRWKPRLLRRVGLINLGGARIDLGGIGKGLAIRWAAEQMAVATSDFLIEAGGDTYAAGAPELGVGWKIGVESPVEGDGPLAVLEVRDAAVATSSVRIRHWIRDGRLVHHIIDPRTGQPGGGNLASVTVVHDDPAMAEVWSKVAFLAGPERIRAFLGLRHLAALWVDAAGAVRWNHGMKQHIVWYRP